jgi:hypothetical protein
MEKTKFRLNLFGPVFIGILWLSLLFVVIYSGFSINILLSGELSLQSWLLLFILGVFFFLAPAIPTWYVIREWSTTFDKQGIRQISLRGYKKILWNDVTRVEDIGIILYIKSKAVWITMNLALYKNPPEVVEFVNRMSNVNKDSSSV